MASRPPASYPTTSSSSTSGKKWGPDESWVKTQGRSTPDQNRRQHRLSTFKGGELPEPVNSTHSSARRSRRHAPPLGRKLLGKVVRAVKARWGTETLSSLYTSREDSPERGSIDTSPPAADVEVFSLSEGSSGNMLNKVVVDRDWAMAGATIDKAANSDHDNTPENKSTTSPQDGSAVGDTRLQAHRPWWSFARIYALAKHFFQPVTMVDELECRYRQEDWTWNKRIAEIASFWLVVNWVLGIAVIPQPFAVIDKVFYYALGPAFSVPIIIMVLLDWPRDRRFIYQIYLSFSLWMWALYQVLYIYICGYYDASHSLFQCANGRDFLSLFYYATAMQTIGLFGLRMERLPAVICASIFFIFTAVFILPDRDNWARLMLNFVFFHVFLVYIHYRREKTERKLYQTQHEFRIQHQATLKAQRNERKTSDSKRRLTSYVFHEVRVPLNTAMLAVQNMEATGTIVKELEIEFRALKGSLDMMSKVLNDVLDFNRMDSGHFESVSRPYAFHKAMSSLFAPIQLATKAKGQLFIAKTDPNIDLVARRAVYLAMGQSKESIEQQLAQHTDVNGVVVGDEARLRQIVNNLAGNACKFTPEGGTITISTHLVVPQVKEDGDIIYEDGPGGKEGHEHALSADHLKRHNDEHELSTIVVRIEVQDTGCGIDPQEMVRSKLFSAFNQTEQGKLQGGKGTGLGLALVRNIVKLSGGRMGVQSVKGMGSTFWVELPLGVGSKALQPPEGSADTMTRTSSSEPKRKLSKPGSAGDVTPTTASPGSLPVKSSAGPSLMVPQTGTPNGHRQTASSGSTPNTTVSDPFAATFGSIQSSSRRNSFTDFAQVSPSPLGDTVTSTTPQRPNMTHRQTSSIASNTSAASNAMMAFDQKFNLPSSDSIPGSASELPENLSVLVVDDDEITRRMMTRMFQRLKSRVSVAENGQVAVQMILGPDWSPVSEGPGSVRFVQDETTEKVPGPSPALAPPSPPSPGGSSVSPREEYDIVFMDNQMPVLSGLQAVKLLRGLGRKDYIIGLTGNALQPDQEEFLNAGVDVVLTKPVYESSIREVLRQSAANRKLKTREKGLS